MLTSSIIYKNIYAYKVSIHSVRSRIILVYRFSTFILLALNIQDEILRLIGTGIILQIQSLQHNVNEHMNKAIEFYSQTSQRHSIYCKQLELADSSWDMFIQRILYRSIFNSWQRWINFCIEKMRIITITIIIIYILHVLIEYLTRKRKMCPSVT